MGLAALPLEALDLEDLLAAGLLMEQPPRPAADVTGNADDMPPTRRRRTTTGAIVLSDKELEDLRQLAESTDLESLLADDPLERLS